MSQEIVKPEQPVEEVTKLDPPIPGIDSEEERTAVESIVNSLVDADKDRMRQLRGIYKRHELFWHGIHKIVQDDISQDWVTPEGFLRDHRNFQMDRNAMEDRPINIYRAHGESIIAALSTGLPFVRFFPDDADNSDDINTAKAASKISELVQTQNQAQLLFIYALFILYNQGVVYAYTFHDESAEYGVITKYRLAQKTEQIEQEVCPTCSYPFTEEDIDPETGNFACKECGQSIPPNEVIPQSLEAEVPFLEEYTEPKTQEKIELFGPLNVRVAPYVRKLRDSPYLVLEIEQHISLLREIYPDFFDRIDGGSRAQSYDRWSRSNSVFENKDVLTVRKVWLRDYAFNILGTSEDQVDIINALKTKFEKGACFTFIEDQLVDAYDDNLDARWTASESPLDSRHHADPIGSPVLPIQEIRTELVELIVETIEQGIPQTFADPDVLDFDAFRDNQNGVGLVHPAKSRGGQDLSKHFFQLSTATLHQETRNFLMGLDQDAQFVGGAFPSVFGGMIKGGSQTAAEYEMSRNQALQRLSTPWKVLNNWWARVMEKCVKSYIENSRDDEKVVKPQGDSFINVWIRKSELGGKLGGATSETSEQFPVSWVQKRGMLLELLNMQDPFTMQAMADPENIQKANGMLHPDLKAPGADDRDKQLAEISELLKGEPYEEEQVDPMTKLPTVDLQTGFPVPPKILPSVPIDTSVDWHEIHIATIKAWAVSPVGRAAKTDNPAGYANVIAHLDLHNEAMAPPPGMGVPAGETAPGQQKVNNV